MSDFRLEPLSFLIGLVGGILAALIYDRLRPRLRRMRQNLQERAERARRFATRTADARYQIDILNRCQRYHIAGDKIALTEILMEPRFIQGVQVYDPTGDRTLQDVLRVLPLLHEYPASYGAYNIKTFGIEDLGNGDLHLALLGIPGSGRSTALAAIALWAMYQIEFEAAVDIVQQEIAEEEALLPEKEREALRKRRQEIQERALEQLAQSEENEAEAERPTEDADEETAPQRASVDLHHLMPILVHMDDIVIDVEPEQEIDPAEPLVRAIQHNVRRLTALTAPRYIYNRLNSGQALVLIDGLDDLPEAAQTAKIAWLQRFIAAYDQCIIIVAGPAAGYYTLQQVGLTPIFIRPWMDTTVRSYTQKWAAQWPVIAGSKRRPALPPDELIVQETATNTRGLTPLDLTLKILSAYTDPEHIAEQTRWDWYNNFIVQNFNLQGFNDDDADAALYAVTELAARILVSGAMSTDTLTTALTEILSNGDQADSEAAQKPNLEPEKFLKAWHGSSALVTTHINNRSAFRHPLLTAFLAGVSLADEASAPSLVDVINDPAWKRAIPFAAAQASPESMGRAVLQKLKAQPDLLFTSLFDVVSWLADAPADAPWKGEIYKRLAAALIAPTQFPALRERALAALVASRDKSVIFILRQALRSTDPFVRKLGSIGLGALGDREAIKDLRPMLEDEEIDVQLAAGLALGAIGTEKALEVMVDALLDGEESLRQAIAEALAAIPGEGHRLLHTAITSDDMMVRRAAVFGLARINAPWALTDLYYAMLEDEQWYVRSAAEGTFTKARERVESTARAHPAMQEIEWVTDWAAEHKVPIPEGEKAPALLVRMMQSGSQAYRIASARTLGYIGFVPAVGPLYQALQDESDDIRAAGFAALTDLQSQVGAKLPSVH